jgi:hypothetical protein
MGSRIRLIRSFMAVALLVSLLVINAHGQQAVTSGTISVRVTDTSGAVIPGVQIAISNTDFNQSWKTEGDGQGAGRFLLLPLGSYELVVEKGGFSTYTAKLTLSVGQSLEIPVTLNVASVNEQVVVTEQVPLIEVARTQVANNIEPREIASLPLNGRNYIDLALLVPGVSKTNTGNNERFAETSAVPGTGISVAGQRNLANGFVVDGLSSNDDAADLAGTFYSQEVIREFQVITSGGIAEFGRASSGIMNIVTQSGTNTWHAKLYGFFRNHRFDATNVFAPVDTATGQRIRTPLTQAQYGATLGGPLRHDRIFLFTNFEREDLNSSGFITISPANLAAINSVLDRLAYLPPRVATGAYPTGESRTSYFAKTDITLSPTNRLAVRYSLYDIFSPNARGIGSLSAASRGTSLGDRDHSIAVNDVATLSGTSFNELRFQFTRSKLKAPGNDLVGPAVSISGVANFGASTSSPTGRDLDLIEIAEAYSMTKGKHFLKVGGVFLENRVNIAFPGSVYGSYSFTSLPNFQAGLYNTYGQAFGKEEWFQTNPNLGWFVQDEWRMNKDLTVNLGLRHDLSWMAADIETQPANFSPRLGLAYALGDHKTVIRAGAGLYYDRVPLRAVANALRGAGKEYKTVTLQRTQLGAPVFPNKLTSFPAGTLFNLASIDPDIKNSYTIQSNLQIEHELLRRTSVSLGYLRTRGLHIIMSRNLNVPALTAAQDPVNLGRPNPNFANISQYSGQGDSYYNGLTLAVQHRATTWASVRLSYALSKAIDNTGNAFFSSPQDNFNIRDDRGLSDNDQRHRMTLSGQIAVPHSSSREAWRRVFEGFQLCPIFTYGSPYPFNIVTGGQTIQTTAARPTGVGRNTGVGFNYKNLDLRLSREFHMQEKIRVEFIGEMFNALNRTNLQFPNNTWGTGAVPLGTFGKPTNANDPRQIQFGLRVTL